MVDVGGNQTIVGVGVAVAGSNVSVGSGGNCVWIGVQAENIQAMLNDKPKTRKMGADRVRRALLIEYLIDACLRKVRYQAISTT